MKLWAVGLAVAAGAAAYFKASAGDGAAGDTAASVDTGTTATVAPGGADVNNLVQAFMTGIAHGEGFLPPPRPGAPLNKPQRLHNPVDITDGANPVGTIRQFSSDADGWAALARKLQNILNGGSRVYPLTDSLYAFAAKWTPPGATGNSAASTRAWCDQLVVALNAAGFSCDQSTTLNELVNPPAPSVIALDPSAGDQASPAGAASANSAPADGSILPLADTGIVDGGGGEDA
jgi:hypothetical protein